MSEEIMPSFDDADTTPRTRLNKGKLAGAVFTIAALGAFGAALYFVVLPQFKEPNASTTQTASEVTDIAQRLMAAEAKIETLEKSIAELKAAPVPASAPASNADTDAKIAALSAQLETLSKNSGSPSGLQSIALLDAFTQLHRAATQGLPFSVEMHTLTQLASGRPKTLSLLSALQPFEAKSAPTVPQLQKQLADAIKQAGAHTETDNSLGANLRSLIRIRKEGRAQGDDDESMIARAEAAMNEGDVNVASKELEQLSAAQMPYFENWLKNAKLYATEQAAIEALQADIVQPVAAAPVAAPAAP